MKVHLLTSLLFLSSALFAQENSLVILEEYIRAIGGQQNADRVQSIYSLADCTGLNGDYQTEIYSAKGSRTVFRQIRKNKPDYTGITNGNTYWTTGTEATISDKYAAYAWRSHELQWIATHLTDRFHDMKRAGDEFFAGKNAVQLSATDELGKPARLYFDGKTKLWLGMIVFSPLGDTTEMIRMEVREWKKTGKLLLPSNVLFSDKKGDFILSFHTIKIDRVDSAIFNIPPKISAVKKLLELHELQRTAHFNRDAALLVSLMTDDFTEITDGKVVSPSKADLISRFKAYFDAVTFIEWDDTQPPVIRISEDATIAYMHVSKKVVVKTRDEKLESSTFAWTSTFQKVKDGWMMKSITSTVAKRKS